MPYVTWDFCDCVTTGNQPCQRRSNHTGACDPTPVGTGNRDDGDADVLAELREDEREWFRAAGLGGSSTLIVRSALRRLALARREAREAAAVEREEIAALLEDDSEHRGSWCELMRELARMIRARGQS